MKLLVWCAQCGDEGVIDDLGVVPLNASGLYRFACPNGHVTHTILQERHYDVLAEVALQGIVDGYPREAVSSFAASLERFMEHYVRVVLSHEGTPLEVIEAGWKHVSNQSERQLGVFAGLYVSLNSKWPPFLAQKWMKFRNEVIHKGRIPTEDEAVTYGQAIVDFIEPLLRDLQERYGEATLNVRRADQMAASAPFASSDAKWSYVSKAMVYDLLCPAQGTETGDNPTTLRQLVVSRRKRQRESGLNAFQVL